VDLKSLLLIQFHSSLFFSTLSSPVLEAARRKRAMEISAVRKGRAKPFSLA
jgi:hypothetical protein